MTYLEIFKKHDLLGNVCILERWEDNGEFKYDNYYFDCQEDIDGLKLSITETEVKNEYGGIALHIEIRSEYDNIHFLDGRFYEPMAHMLYDSTRNYKLIIKKLEDGDRSKSYSLHADFK